MEKDGYSFMLDSATKFFRSFYIYGWFHHPEDKLASVSLIDTDCIQSLSRTDLDHQGVQSLGSGLGFEIQVLRNSEEICEDVKIEFVTKKGIRIVIDLLDLCKDRISHYPSIDIAQRFSEEVRKNNLSLLDIGGRSRSRLDRKKDFSTNDYTVLDIIPGDNVDIVGDAHCLSSLFPENRFDAVLSVSVFEHLLMPWTVVTQINRVLKTGGIGLISTHQTLGLHDMPWDFWRFSDTAWDALFNAHTGFEIIERSMDFEQYILPFIYRPSKHQAERSAGFEGSSVLIKKIGPCKMSWDLKPTDITQSTYPDNDDGFQSDGFGGLH